MHKKLGTKIRLIIGLFIVFFLVPVTSKSQTIKGVILNSSTKEIELIGFNGFSNYNINSSILDSNGFFSIDYSEKDFGIGFLKIDKAIPLLLILNGEVVEIYSENFYNKDVKILSGEKNILFEKYSNEQPLRETILANLSFLKKVYTEESFFSSNKKFYNSLNKEYKRINTDVNKIFQELDEESILNIYIKLIHLINQNSKITTLNKSQVLNNILSFRKLDYSNLTLYKSGLLQNVLESHLWLIENSGFNSSKVEKEINFSIELIINQLNLDEIKFNEIVNFLFDYLEKRSLFKNSEFLALKVLNSENCTVNNNLSTKLESYRKMKVGEIAPEIYFDYDMIYNKMIGNNVIKKMTDINSDYYIIIFGSSWCSKCIEDSPKLNQLYSQWESNGYEVIFVSLDHNKEDFISSFSNFDFYSICDYQNWNSKTVKDYYVSSTPSIFVLNKNRKIILRPRSINHLSSWVEWHSKEQVEK